MMNGRRFAYRRVFNSAVPTRGRTAALSAGCPTACRFLGTGGRFGVLMVGAAADLVRAGSPLVVGDLPELVAQEGGEGVLVEVVDGGEDPGCDGVGAVVRW